MKRRLILALMLMGCGSAAAQATADFPYGPSHVFAAFRNGERIGTHTLTFQQNGDKRTVTTSIDFAVKALGLTMYRYMHRGQEVWNGNTFESIATQTDDNGTKFGIKARNDAAGLAVVREGSGAPKMTASDVGFQQGTPNQATLPSSTLPSTHWNLNQVKQSAMLNSPERRPGQGPDHASGAARRSRPRTAPWRRPATPIPATSRWISGSTTAAAG